MPQPFERTATGTELECLEWGCDWTTSAPFPVCIDELLAHDCGGSDVVA